MTELLATRKCGQLFSLLSEPYIPDLQPVPAL